ncbi:helicase-related protein [Vibrio hannami]|uniref:helicase-related protein n=1 Tax=Vibrio hannami TaxID=2717094 RepID=UPI00240FCEC3|nr:helicase-related protein [Vibrio hannami]MDG3087993.1 helicase-related protein [Vibrio hannami]
MNSLPINAIFPEFEKRVQSDHLVVEAETGSGKSTCLPLWAAKYGRVLVIEPRRIACTSLAEYLAEQDGSPLGKKIGYAIKLESRFDQITEVVFVTPGVALRWLSEGALSQFDYVMIDEFHERRWDTDLLLALLLKANQHRLIVTSATMEGEKLCNYINGKRLISEGRNYHVSVRYRARDSHYLPDSRNIEQGVFDAVEQALKETSGDILVFLPGRKEITQCAQKLRSFSDIEIVPLHASVSDNERYRALHQLERQKVVLATNVAETSLTIPNITVVIDSGLERRTLQRNGRTVLSLKSISKASAKQRAGRAGRVTDGTCVRLYGEFAPLELVTPPELMREELTEAMLASACCDNRLEDLDFLDSLPEKSLTNAKSMLHSMEAIDEKGKATDHGRLLYPLPIDAIYADLLTRMPTKTLKEAMVDLSAALSVPASIFKLPNSEQKLEMVAQWEPLSCDAITYLKLIRDEKCEALEVDFDALKEAKGLSQQMREALGLPKLEVASRFDRDAFVKAIIESHPELVYVRREKRRDAMGNGLAEVLPGRNSRFSDKDEAAIVLDQHSVPGRGVKQTLNLASVTMPVTLKTLKELELGDWQQGETVMTESGISSILNLVYAGRCIATKEIEPEGELLVKPLVEAVTSGALLPGLAEKRIQEIEHWKLYVDLKLDERCSDHENLTFESWFTKQLKDLGVTSVEELDIFSEEDFEFDGIPYWEYKNFAETYPYHLNIGDLRLGVEYMPSRKLIYVIYKSGLRKADPKRIELPVWKGWRIQYKKASRIVDIR